MSDSFIIKPKNKEKKGDKSVVMTLRIDRVLQEEFDRLSIKSNYSKNELMCKALRFALEHLEFIPTSDSSLNELNISNKS